MRLASGSRSGCRLASGSVGAGKARQAVAEQRGDEAEMTQRALGELARIEGGGSRVIFRPSSSRRVGIGSIVTFCGPMKKSDRATG